MARTVRTLLLRGLAQTVVSVALLTVAWTPANAAGSKWLPIGVGGIGGVAVDHSMQKNMGTWIDTFRKVAGSVDATGRGDDGTLDRIDATLRDAPGSIVREAILPIKILGEIMEAPQEIKRQLVAVKDKFARYVSGDTGRSALAIDPEDRVYLKRNGVIGPKPLPSARLKPPPSARAAKSGSPRSSTAIAARDPWGASPKKASWDEPDPWADPPVTDPDTATVDEWAQNCIGLKEKPSSKSADFMLFKQMREDYIRKHGTADCAPAHADRRRPANGAGSGEPRESYRQALERTLGDDPRTVDGSYAAALDAMEYAAALDAMEKAERERELAAARERELARQRELAAVRERELARQRELAAAREREQARQRELAEAREREQARQRELAAARERELAREREQARHQELNRQREQAAAWEREAEAERQRRYDAAVLERVRAFNEQANRARAQERQALTNMLRRFSSSGQSRSPDLGQYGRIKEGCDPRRYRCPTYRTPTYNPAPEYRGSGWRSNSGSTGRR